MFRSVEGSHPVTVRIGAVAGDGRSVVAASETIEQALARVGAECGWSDAASRPAGSPAVEADPGGAARAVARRG
jgi:hypothetical protein